MLKAIVNYSKKVPVEGQEYSSQGYSLSLETEVPETDPRAIQSRLHDTFELVKSSVEQELANGNGTRPGPRDPGANEAPRPPARGTGKASNRQIKFLTDLATQRGIGIGELNAEIRKRFGVAGLYDLSRRDASLLLDELNGKKAA